MSIQGSVNSIFNQALGGIVAYKATAALQGVNDIKKAIIEQKERRAMTKEELVNKTKEDWSIQLKQLSQRQRDKLVRSVPSTATKASDLSVSQMKKKKLSPQEEKIYEDYIKESTTKSQKDEPLETSLGTIDKNHPLYDKLKNIMR